MLSEKCISQLWFRKTSICHALKLSCYYWHSEDQCSPNIEETAGKEFLLTSGFPIFWPIPIRKANTRIACIQEMMNAFSTKKAKETIIAIDEKWIYIRDVPVTPKECNHAWSEGAGTRPIVTRRTIIIWSKNFIIVASIFTKTLTYFKLLQDGGSVNEDRYPQFLQNMILNSKEHYCRRKGTFSMTIPNFTSPIWFEVGLAIMIIINMYIRIGPIYVCKRVHTI